MREFNPDSYEKFLSFREKIHHITQEPIDQHCERFFVSRESCADIVGSGSKEVYATPSLAALMEKTAFTLGQKYVSPGNTTVGARLELSHLKPSVVGELITCTAYLLSNDGRKQIYWIEAHNDNGILIGTCYHERYQVQ